MICDQNKPKKTPNNKQQQNPAQKFSNPALKSTKTLK